MWGEDGWLQGGGARQGLGRLFNPRGPERGGKQTVSPTLSCSQLRRALGGTRGWQLPHCPSPDLVRDLPRDSLSWCVTVATGAPPWLAVSRARKVPPGHLWGGSHPLNPTCADPLRILLQAAVPASPVE